MHFTHYSLEWPLLCKYELLLNAVGEGNNNVLLPLSLSLSFSFIS